MKKILFLILISLNSTFIFGCECGSDAHSCNDGTACCSNNYAEMMACGQ